MKKLLIALLTSFITISSFADTSPDFKKNDEAMKAQKTQTLNSIKEIVIFNASIIGFAKFCNSDVNKSKSVLTNFNHIMSGLNLNDEDSKFLENEFINAANLAKTGKNLPANFNCITFNKNLDEIFNYIQTGKNIK